MRKFKPANPHAPPLFTNQAESIEALLETPIGYDASDPGTGKTRVQIELFAHRRKHGGKCALVIAPKTLLTAAWETDLFNYAPHLKASVARATNREKAFAADADIYITNTDAVKWLVKQPKKFFDRFDTLIIDEASTFKHATSQRSKAAMRVSKHFLYRYLMSGTPNTNSLTELWHQYFLLDAGKRLGSSYFHFRSSVCTPQQTGPDPRHIQWLDKPGAENAVAALVADITVRHRFDDCMDIPKNHKYPVHFDLAPKTLKAYKQMEAAAIAQLKDGQIVSAANAAVVTNKLMQIASGASYIDGEDSTQYSVLDNSRADLIVELVEAREQCVVFFNWTHQREQLLNAFQAKGISVQVIDGSISDTLRMDAVNKFQSGELKVILAHPQSAAHGLTLTKGTTTIWASPTFNLEHFLQGNRRIYRAGQKRKTETIIIVAKGTIDEKVMERLKDKDARQTSTLDLLQQLFRGKSK